MPNGNLKMVKIKESSIDPIRRNRYYIWTWVPKKYQRRTKKWLYLKHLTGVPYFTRKQIKITLTYIYGVDVLAYIHIISGDKLIKQGIYHISDVNPYPRGSMKFWYKGHMVMAKKFIIPPEDKIDKHRRRHFMVKMHQTVKRHGKKRFDQIYQEKLIGQRRSISSKYIHKKRLSIYRTLIPHLQEITGKGEEDIRQMLYKLSPDRKVLGPLV